MEQQMKKKEKWINKNEFLEQLGSEILFPQKDVEKVLNASNKIIYLLDEFWGLMSAKMVIKHGPETQNWEEVPKNNQYIMKW